MVEPLRFGIALTSDPDSSGQKLERMCSALSSQSGLEVEPGGHWHYEALVGALADGTLDLAWLPPMLALRATGRRNAIPLVLPVRHGLSTYSTALFTRNDGLLRTLDDVRGVRAAWVDSRSASGYLVVRALLRSKGLDPAELFSRETFVGSHEAVVRAVDSGEADVGASFVYLDPDSSKGMTFPQSAGWGNKSMHMLTCAGSIPSDVIACRVDLSTDVRQILVSCLTNASDSPPEILELLAAEDFLAPNEAHLASLVEILQSLEQDDDRPSFLPPLM